LETGCRSSVAPAPHVSQSSAKAKAFNPSNTYNEELLIAHYFKPVYNVPKINLISKPNTPNNAITTHSAHQLSFIEVQRGGEMS
jgi:hypothetical protein